MFTRIAKRSGWVLLNVTLTSAVLFTLFNYVVRAGSGCMDPPYTPSPGTACYVGDVNGDDLLDVADAIHLLSYLYEDGVPPVAMAQPGCDVYDDCFVGEGEMDSIVADMIVDGTVDEGHLAFDTATQAELDAVPAAALTQTQIDDLLALPSMPAASLTQEEIDDLLDLPGAPALTLTQQQIDDLLALLATPPEQPTDACFEAFSDENDLQTYSPGITQVTFAQTSFDTAAAFSLAGGVFVAPKAGKYHFAASISISSGSVVLSSELYISKNALPTFARLAMEDMQGQTNGGLSGSIILDLEAGDSVGLYLNTAAYAGVTDIAGTVLETHHKFFTGCYLP